MTSCQHCARDIVQDNDGTWIDPDAIGDDSIWRETCDAHDTFTAEHEPDNDADDCDANGIPYPTSALAGGFWL